MFRFLPGVLLAQIAAGALLWLNLDALDTPMGWARFLVPAVVISLVIAFWFGAVARHASDERVAKLREDFAREREKIKVDAERAKTKVVEKTQKQIAKESKRTNAKASFKVGAALTALVGFGVVMTFTQFAMMGLLLLGGAGAAFGGYALKLRRNRSDVLEAPQRKGVKRLLGR